MSHGKLSDEEKAEWKRMKKSGWTTRKIGDYHQAYHPDDPMAANGSGLSRTAAIANCVYEQSLFKK